METSTIRVPAERLDEMMDRVGELVIAQARLTQLAATEGAGGAKGVAEEIERLTSALRDAMMGIRMVPIGSLFGRFRRLVHDLSRDLGKEIDLTTAGEETELDKTMIERLADPLVHVIRNAADHGLEDAETRVAAGKPAVGQHQPRRASRRRRGADQRQRGRPRPRRPAHRAKAEENGLIAAGAVLPTPTLSGTIRVPAERLDEMMDRVGELVIAQARLSQLAAQPARGTKGVAEEIERLTSALRDAMMGIRMVPIGSLFGRFRRLVHDLSRDLGKEIDLTTAGEETELDKTMIERLADPLVHVIRNAADHGLETPRRASRRASRRRATSTWSRVTPAPKC